MPSIRMSGKVRRIICVCIERQKRYRKQNFIVPFKYEMQYL